ncbi:hypothetical protein ACS2CQ_23275 [Bacillus cereus group sp. BceL295]|uniref:hypothetical protein n=1 Tax=Bacillus cereus group sp. BceL295 TaxID=3444990 RepID=UPI003F25EDB3|nr:hypothetical protein [Bacillus cereus]
MRKKKLGKKINGRIGHARNFLITVVWGLELGLVVYMSFYFGVGIIFVFLMGSTMYYYYLKFSGKYHVRAITNEEYQEIKGRKLIHYTDFFYEEQLINYKQTGLINLIGNSSASSNYRMRYKDKCKKFVWFHIESESEKNEPYFSSFVENHFFEGVPRKYKILINAVDLKKEQLFINPANENVLVLGDVLVKGRIEEKFNWYNDKLYFKSVLGSAKYILILLPISGQQLLGNLINKLSKF